MVPSLLRIAKKCFNTENTETQGKKKLLLRVNADEVDEHLLGKLRGVVRRARPSAAHGEVQQQEERMVEDPGSAGGPLGLREGRVEIRVHVETNDARLPFDRIEMKVVREVLSRGKAEGS